MIFIPTRGGTEYNIVMSPVRFGLYITSVEQLVLKRQLPGFSDILCSMHSAYSAPWCLTSNNYLTSVCVDDPNTILSYRKRVI